MPHAPCTELVQLWTEWGEWPSTIVSTETATENLPLPMLFQNLTQPHQELEFGSPWTWTSTKYTRNHSW